MRLKPFSFLFFLLCLISCSSDSATTSLDSSTTSEPPNETVQSSTTEASTEELNEALSLSVSIEPTPYSPIAASLDIQSSLPVAVQVIASSEEHAVTTARTSTFSYSHIFPLVGLRQSQSYDIEVLAIDESGETSTFSSGTFVSGEINFPLPEFDLYVDLELAQPGVTLIAVSYTHLTLPTIYSV